MARVDWFKVSGYMLLWGTALIGAAYVVAGVVWAVEGSLWLPLAMGMNAVFMFYLNRVMARGVADCKRANWYQEGTTHG